MLTGLGLQAHQVTWNSYEPERGLVKVPTIFSIAKGFGCTTGMFVGKEKFKHLLLPGSVDCFVWPQPDDGALEVAKAFVAQAGSLKPNLCLIHFKDPDTTGHNYGAGSAEKMAALADCDRALKMIVDATAEAGILDRSVFILTADHGSHDVTDKEGHVRGTHGSAETADVVIPWVVWGAGVRKHFTVSVPVVQYDTAATALWLLDIPIPEQFWGHPIISAFE